MQLKCNTLSKSKKKVKVLYYIASLWLSQVGLETSTGTCECDEGQAESI